MTDFLSFLIWTTEQREDDEGNWPQAGSYELLGRSEGEGHSFVHVVGGAKESRFW